MSENEEELYRRWLIGYFLNNVRKENNISIYSNEAQFWAMRNADEILNAYKQIKES